jgi:hypothetical protein
MNAGLLIKRQEVSNGIVYFDNNVVPLNDPAVYAYF